MKADLGSRLATSDDVWQPWMTCALKQAATSMQEDPNGSNDHFLSTLKWLSEGFRQHKHQSFGMAANSVIMMNQELSCFSLGLKGQDIRSVVQSVK